MILAIYTNQAQSETTAYLISALMITALIFGIASGRFKMKDKFDIGYIDEAKPRKVHSTLVTEVKETYDEVKDLKRQIEILKLKKQLEELQKPSFDKALFDDCVDVLVGLGSPARKAKSEAQNTFEKNPNIQTVQEFITEYGRR